MHLPAAVRNCGDEGRAAAAIPGSARAVDYVSNPMSDGLMFTKFILPHQSTVNVLAVAPIGGRPFWIAHVKSASIEAGSVFRQIHSTNLRRRVEALYLYHWARP